MAENRGWLDNLDGKGVVRAGLAVVVALAGGSWLIKQNRPAVDPASAADRQALAVAAFPGGPAPVPGMQPALPAAPGVSYVPLPGHVPGAQLDPWGGCLVCHDEEDRARYAKTFGPMLLAMNPAAWSDPNVLLQATTPLADPGTYAEWYAAWTKAFDGLQPKAQPDAAQKKQEQ